MCTTVKTWNFYSSFKMIFGYSSIFLICCIFLTLQLTFGQAINNAFNYLMNEEKLRMQEIGSSNYIVYPEFYDFEKERKRTFDEVSTLTLILKAVNLTYYIELQTNLDLDGVPVHFEDEFWESADHERRCHFHGRIISEPTGFVAISACSDDGRMTGVLMTETKIYFLVPSYKGKNNGSYEEHYLREYSPENSEFCGIGNGKGFGFLGESVPKNGFVHYDNMNRIKRDTASPTRKVIEVAIFVDSDLYRRIETTSTNARRATVRRVLGIMNQVQLIYNYSSLQTKFKIVIVKLQILKQNQNAPSPENGDIDKYLDSFCVWQSKLNAREGNEGHWDHAIMLSGKDLYKETRGKRNPKVLGLAWVNGMCRTNYSCTLNEGSSFEAAFVIAHEIAHNLGVMHDGSGNNCDRDKYIMSDKTGPGKVHWSACSNVYMRNFFGSGNGKCLSDDASPPNRSYDLDSRSLPGMRYSLSDQCILALGSGYSPHKSSKEPFDNVCRELWCASGSWAKPAHPALEGSSCAEGKLCLEGTCRKARSSDNIRTTNSSTKDVVLNTGRQLINTENNGVLKKIQETVMKAIRNLG